MLVAYLATVPAIRRTTERLTGPYPDDSTVSAWWILFERWRNGRDVQVACMLDDGSAVRGQLGSFNTSADDSPDRDLILKEPIYRPPGETANEVLWDMSAVCCPARRIVSLFVIYSEPVQTEPYSCAGAAGVSDICCVCGAVGGSADIGGFDAGAGAAFAPPAIFWPLSACRARSGTSILLSRWPLSTRCVSDDSPFVFAIRGSPR